MGVTGFQWATLTLGALAFLITWTGLAVGWGRLIEKIKSDTTEKVSVASKAFRTELDEMRSEFLTEQRDQDHNFGEVGAAMRQYIADVEKKLREVEIYGRDNYVKIPDFEKAIDRLGETMTAGFAEIKKDIRGLLKPPN